MTKSELKEKFARLGPTLAIDLVKSGSPEDVALAPIPNVRLTRTVDAILVLRRGGLTMLRAKRTIEAAIDEGKAFVTIPCVADKHALGEELRELGFMLFIRTPAAVDVRRLRDSLGLTQEQFAMRYGLDIDAVRNWEYGRREPDTAAKSLLRVIEHDPKFVEAALDTPAL